MGKIPIKGTETAVELTVWVTGELQRVWEVAA